MIPVIPRCFVRLLEPLNVKIFLWYGMFFSLKKSAKVLLNMEGKCTDYMDGGMQLFQIWPFNIRSFRAVCDLDIKDIDFLCLV